jgi:hypothetical protein
MIDRSTIFVSSVLPTSVESLFGGARRIRGSNMERNHLYEVWFSRGAGLRRGPKFRARHDAERYVAEHWGEATFAVKAPDGHWETFARERDS